MDWRTPINLPLPIQRLIKLAFFGLVAFAGGAFVPAHGCGLYSALLSFMCNLVLFVALPIIACELKGRRAFSIACVGVFVAASIVTALAQGALHQDWFPRWALTHGAL
jgi:hypothetical protein